MGDTLEGGRHKLSSGPHCRYQVRHQEGYSSYKRYDSEGKGFLYASVTVLKGKVSWQLNAKKYHKVTPHNKHTQEILEKTRDGGCLCLKEKQQGTGQEAGSYGGVVSRVGICRISSPELEQLRNWWVWVSFQTQKWAQTFYPTQSTLKIKQ